MIAAFFATAVRLIGRGSCMLLEASASCSLRPGHRSFGPIAIPIDGFQSMFHYCQATMVLPSVELTTESDCDKNSISSRCATAGGSRNKRDGSSPARQPPPGAYLPRSLLHLLLPSEALLSMAEPRAPPSANCLFASFFPHIYFDTFHRENTGKRVAHERTERMSIAV
ncbi:hypothetical protein PMIN03_013092 [Paraphaeosphaeria minitans]